MRVTCIFLCYNCENFVAAALESLLTQDFAEPMEIIISDDASTDATFEVVQRMLEDYSGPHRIRALRQPTNTGSKSAHLNEVLPLVSNDILISFDADDIFQPQRVRKIVEAFRRDPGIAAVYSQLLTIDEAGRPLGSGRVPRRPAGTSADRWFARVDAYASGGTLAIHRKVVASFPPLDKDIYEDVVLPFRASLLGDVAFIDEPLILARRHGGSLTADFSQFRSIENYRKRMLRGMEKVRSQLASRLADIDVARRIDPGREKDWVELEQIARASLADAEKTVPLLSPNPVTRWLALARLIVAGIHRRDLLQNVALAFTPSLYLRYKLWRLTGRGGTQRLLAAPDR